MKLYLTITMFALAIINTFSQTRLCEEKSVMYSICFNLDTNGTFSYDYSHCTGSVLGSGKYTRTKKALTFEFDTLISPQVYRLKDDQLKGKVKITHYHLTDGYPKEFAKIDHSGRTYNTDTNGAVVLDYAGGPIVVFQYFNKDSLIISPDRDTCNSYEVFWHSPGDSFVDAKKKIKMKKVRAKYKLREKELGYNERKDIYYPIIRTTYYIEKK